MLILLDVTSHSTQTAHPQIVWEECLQSPAARALDRKLGVAASTCGIPLLGGILAHSDQESLENAADDNSIFSEPEFHVTGTISATLSRATLPDLEFEF